MYEPNTQDEQALRSQLGQSRERLDDLVRNLEAIEGELEDLAGEREQYRLLGEACSALEELSARGVSALFWGELAPNGSGEEHVLRVRRRIDGFDKRVGEVEERRAAILVQIEGEQETADFLEDDLYEIQRLEEERKLEWIVEREPAAEAKRPAIMPWTRGGEDDQRFRKSLAAALLLSLFLGLVFPLIELPLPEAWETVEVPERFTQLIKEEQPLPPQQPVPTRPETDSETQSQEEAAEPKPTPDQSPAPNAESKGILAFREKFSGLADSVDDRLGAQARIDSSGAVGASRTERSLVATQGSQSSGGINVSALSRDVGGGGGQGIDGVQIARATSTIGGTGDSDRPLSDGPGPSRTDEEIQIVFDRHKAALYRLYNRELRRNPTLQGQMVLRLTIEPDGSVSLCELKSTDMDAPQLAAQVVGRVKTFDFGAKEGIPPVTILYPIDFLPAT